MLPSCRGVISIKEQLVPEQVRSKWMHFVLCARSATKPQFYPKHNHAIQCKLIQKLPCKTIYYDLI